MSLKLRLARAGSKKRPFYHIVVTEATAPRDGRFIERLGRYNPMLPKDAEERVVLNAERIQHWLSVGAKPTDRVARFLDTADLFKREPRNNPKKAEPGAKAKERLEAKAQAEEDAKAAAAEAEAPAAEPEASEEASA